MKNIEKKAKRSAFEHTVFMALADLQRQIKPDTDLSSYLNMLMDNKKAEENRIINEYIKGNG
ncbi:hypothetical protein ACR777_20140 [Sphingobacterium spiritivorum]|uniref:hypothetical protein n=1 Tax=Sphingobacterium spiritivorum TaxID=258 RepID=UPI003DA40938